MGLMKELLDLNAIYRKMTEVDEAVYGGKKEAPKDNRMVVTNADKKGNTPAYQNMKKGMKGKDGKPMYKAADHMKEEKGKKKNCGCGQDPCITYGKQDSNSMKEGYGKGKKKKKVGHDCASKVKHESYGIGDCIKEMHTLDRFGNITHYDVMFGEQLIKNVPVAHLDVVSEMHHEHYINDDKNAEVLGEKKAAKDYDGDGKIESGKDEYFGSKDKAIKKAMKKESHEVDESIGSAIDKGLSAGADVAKVAGKAAVGGVKVASKVVKKTAGAAGRVAGTAVGAVKSAKKGYKGGASADEEVKIDAMDHYLGELKKVTYASYAKKATTDLANRSFDHGESEKRMYEPDAEDDKETKKQATRKKGIDRAIDKLAKEDLDVFEKLVESGKFTVEEIAKISGIEIDEAQTAYEKARKAAARRAADRNAARRRGEMGGRMERETYTNEAGKEMHYKGYSA